MLLRGKALKLDRTRAKEEVLGHDAHVCDSATQLASAVGRQRELHRAHMTHLVASVENSIRLTALRGELGVIWLHVLQVSSRKIATFVARFHASMHWAVCSSPRDGRTLQCRNKLIANQTA
jgi:hypothetical protein